MGPDTPEQFLFVERDVDLVSPAAIRPWGRPQDDVGVGLSAGNRTPLTVPVGCCRTPGGTSQKTGREFDLVRNVTYSP